MNPTIILIIITIVLVLIIYAIRYVLNNLINKGTDAIGNAYRKSKNVNKGPSVERLADIYPDIAAMHRRNGTATEANPALMQAVRAQGRSIQWRQEVSSRRYMLSRRMFSRTKVMANRQMNSRAWVMASRQMNSRAWGYGQQEINSRMQDIRSIRICSMVRHITKGQILLWHIYLSLQVWL